MSNLTALTVQREGLLKKIRAIEASCEGIENENNAKRVQELNLEQAQYSAQRQEIAAKLAIVDGKLADINAGIMELGGTGVEKIFEAIKNQRWYFIKNKPKVLFDKSTGLLWANLNTFNYLKEGGDGYYSREVDNIISGYSFGMDGFRVPTCYELWQAVEDKTIPFHRNIDSYDWSLLDFYECICEYNGNRKVKLLDTQGATSSSYDNERNAGMLFPCSDYLIQNSDYQEKVNPDNPVYTEKERLQFTLDLFTKNELWPIFADAEVTELYKQIYFEKPKLLAQLQELQT